MTEKTSQKMQFANQFTLVKVKFYKLRVKRDFKQAYFN